MRVFSVQIILIAFFGTIATFVAGGKHDPPPFVSNMGKRSVDGHDSPVAVNNVGRSKRAPQYDFGLPPKDGKWGMGKRSLVDDGRSKRAAYLSRRVPAFGKDKLVPGLMGRSKRAPPPLELDLGNDNQKI